MPEENGKVGVVTVERNGKQIELRGAYRAAKLSGFGGEDTLDMEPALVQQTFEDALAARPIRPSNYTLYFIEGTDKWTPESGRVVDLILKEIASRPAPDVSVIGHTDTVDTSAENDKLSKKRAQKVRKALVDLGVPEDHILASGRGERELLIPTPDNTNEPRNRRVEISVR